MSPKSSRVLTYDGREVQFLGTGVSHDIRWVAWRSDASKAILVGNRGTVLDFDGHSFTELRSNVEQNLRGAAFSPRHPRALIVGNGGVLLYYEGEKIERLATNTNANLRRVAWSPDGSLAIAVGNGGAALLWNGSEVSELSGALNNLRGISWHPRGDYALVVGNYFGLGFAPSPSVYTYSPGANSLVAIAELGKVDLIGVDWRPGGDIALIVGYELLWQEPRVYEWNGQEVKEVSLEGQSVFPTAVAWHPTDDYALIVTGRPGPRGEGGGAILRYKDGRTAKIYEDPEYRMGCVAWRPDGMLALIAGSPRMQTFST